MKVTSWNDFRNKFGGYLPNGYLAYAVRGFFATGGTTCYVVRVSASATPATVALLPLPAAVTSSPITYLSAAVTAKQTQIQLESAYAVSLNDLIAIGDPLTGECVSVTAFVNDQTIAVQPPLQASYPAQVPVYGVNGSALASSAAAGAVELPFLDTAKFHEGDLVSINGGGLSEIRVVSRVTSATCIRIGLALDFGFAEGAAVRILPAALTVSAQSAGCWGNGIQLEITPLDPGNSITRFALRITVDRGDDPLQPVQEEFYPLLSMDPERPASGSDLRPGCHKRYIPDHPANLAPASAECSCNTAPRGRRSTRKRECLFARWRGWGAGKYSVDGGLSGGFGRARDGG